MSDYVELYMDQGADFSTTIQMNDENNNLPQNLAGYIVTSQMKKSMISQNSVASFICSIIDPNSGEIFIELDSGNTSNIPSGTYFFDVKVNDVMSGLKSRLVEGIVIVTPSITR